MSDLDNKLIIEAMSRRGFLGTLGKAAAAAGLSPKLPIPNLKDDDDDDDEYERFDFNDWFINNVRDIIIDNSIGDNKISNALADKIDVMVMGKLTDGGQLSVDLMNLFDKHMDHAFHTGDKFYEALEDPEFVEDAVSDLSNEVITQLNLKQIFANAAAREQRGDKQEDILKDVQAEINNPIQYSKFDTAGGTKEYNYTADSYIMSNKDGKMISEAYLNEIRLRGPWDEMPQGSSGRMEFNPYDKGNEYSYPSRENKPSLSKKKDNIIVKGNQLKDIYNSSEKYYSDPNNVFQSSVNERLEDNGFFIGVLPTEEQRFILARYVKPEEVEVIGGFTTWEDALQTAKNTPGTGITNV
jgi:hypothetical protein